MEPRLVKNNVICATTAPTMRPIISAPIGICFFLGAFSVSFDGGGAAGADWAGGMTEVIPAACVNGSDGSRDEEVDGFEQGAAEMKKRNLWHYGLLTFRG